MSDEGVICGLDTGAYRPFPLLLLPVEIQLQIYRFAWMTGPIEEHRTRVRGNGPEYILRCVKNQLIQREMSKKVKEELSTVCTMRSVCRHMRDVVYEEYFSRTQAVLQSNIILLRPSQSAISNDVRTVIHDSTFISEHVRHACVVINDMDFTSHNGPGDDTLRWLTSLRKLTTLEVVFEQWQDLASRNSIFWRHPGLESAKLGIQSLPRLEKLVFRLKWGHIYPQEEAISWEEFPWFQELRQVFEHAPVSEVRFLPIHSLLPLPKLIYTGC